MDSDYQTILQALQRPINCLTDQDRHTRQEGLRTLARELTRLSTEQLARLFANSHLTKNLIHTLADPIQNNRQMTLDIWEKVIEGGLELQRDHSEPIIQALVARINATPYPEKSEELREKILKMLKSCNRFRESLVPNMAQLSVAMAKCLADPSSSIKNLTCDLIVEVSASAKDIIGKYSLSIIKNLGQNLKHNKYQVRKKTLLTISRLLVTPDAAAHMEHLQVGLKASLSDTKIEVRKAALECIAYLLNYLGPKYLKQCEASLVSFMLMGLNDEHLENAEKCRTLLEKCGSSIRQLYEEDLGEGLQEGSSN